MTKSSTFAKGVLAAATAVAALAVAASASAQSYGGPGYDPCQREASGRAVTGGLLGAAGGAVLGSQVAANHHRSDGSLLGGVLGAIAGASIGHSSAACNSAPRPRQYDDVPPPPPAPGPSAYYQPEPPPPPAYGEGYYAPPPAYVQREVFVYGRHGMRFRVDEDRMGPDGCTVAESPVYMPDGRVDQRFVRVCPDRRGRYHVVD
jgi:hypothetical protein